MACGGGLLFGIVRSCGAKKPGGGGGGGGGGESRNRLGRAKGAKYQQVASNEEANGLVDWDDNWDDDDNWGEDGNSDSSGFVGGEKKGGAKAAAGDNAGSTTAGGRGGDIEEF